MPVSINSPNIGIMHLSMLGLVRPAGKGQRSDLELKKKWLNARSGQRKNCQIQLNSKTRSSFSGFFKGTIFLRIFIRQIFILQKIRHVDFISLFPVLHSLYGYPLTTSWIFVIKIDFDREKSCSRAKTLLVK